MLAVLKQEVSYSSGGEKYKVRMGRGLVSSGNTERGSVPRLSASFQPLPAKLVIWNEIEFFQ